MKTQFITDDTGKKISAVVPIKDYNRMLEELEDLEDVKLYDKAKSEDDGERITFQEAFIKIEAKRKNKK